MPAIESIKALITASPLAAVGLSFLVGVLVGALFGRIGASSGDDEDSIHKVNVTSDDDERKEIVVIRAELEAARSLLEGGDEHEEEIRSQISSLDDAIKRANGRLKLLGRSIRKVKADN